MENFVLINKPVGWTSFDVVAYIRNRVCAVRPEEKNIKVGHAGTLDPFATGLLIVGIGRDATQNLDQFKSLPKTYLANVHLGATSDTDDPTGNIKENNILEKDQPSLKNIQSIVPSFIGKQTQIPPMYSAKKIAGKRLYALARQGLEVKREPAEVEIFDLKILEYAWPLLKIQVSCSSGTYIRVLARDLGEKLGVGGYCEALTRTAIGRYRLESAVAPHDLAL